MPVILRQGGLRVVIFSGDHRPCHVHVFGDGETKIELGAYPEPPVQLWSTAKKPEAKRAMQLVARERDRLIECWIALHGQV